MLCNRRIYIYRFARCLIIVMRSTSEAMHSCQVRTSHVFFFRRVLRAAFYSERRCFVISAGYLSISHAPWTCTLTSIVVFCAHRTVKDYRLSVAASFSYGMSSVGLVCLMKIRWFCVGCGRTDRVHVREQSCGALCDLMKGRHLPESADFCKENARRMWRTT